jgi:hypothetical protein
MSNALLSPLALMTHHDLTANYGRSEGGSDMATDFNSTSALAVVTGSRVRTSMWAVPAHGIRMPFPAPQLGSIVGLTTVAYTATANAAKGATGNKAFEDPV